MTRGPAALLFVFAVVLAGSAAIVTQPACGDIPNKTCRGDQVNALVSDGGDDASPNDCTTCMQSECCDLLGACGEDEQCAAEMKQTQRCLIERGPSKQGECKQNLDGGASKALFGCIRTPCGPSCGIPSCDVDPAVTLFLSPSCDKCITGACCEQINACYKNRRCQLFLECVTNHCPKTTGPSLTQIGTYPAAALEAFEQTVCGTGASRPAPEDDPFDPGACLNRCLNEFAAPDGGLPDENRAASCLAVGVYVCGAKSGCGPECSVDAGELVGPYPEDDAGAPDAH